MRFKFDKKKSQRLRKRRGVGFEEAQEIWTRFYYLDRRCDVPEQWRVIGWIKGKLYSVIYEEREDEDGEYSHLVTLWKSTKEEKKLYEENL